MKQGSPDSQLEHEQRLRRRLEILKSEIEAGKIQVNSGLGVIESLKAVRYGPDGAIDLSTVDGVVRSLALAVEVIHDRDEIKGSLPLLDIQTTYFEFIERNFGTFFKEMRKRRLTPHDVGRAFSESESSCNELASVIPDFVTTIKEYWNAAGPAAHIHLEGFD